MSDQPGERSRGDGTPPPPPPPPPPPSPPPTRSPHPFLQLGASHSGGVDQSPVVSPTLPSPPRSGKLKRTGGISPSSSRSSLRACSPPATPAPTTTQQAEQAVTATPAPASTLSPLARPFYPASSGRPKVLRWLADLDEDDDLLEEDDDPPLQTNRPVSPCRAVSYRDVVASPAAPPSPAAAPPSSAASPPQVRSHGDMQAARDASPARRRPARRSRRRPARRSRRRRPPTELVIGLPVRLGRPPRSTGISDQLRARLGPRVPPGMGAPPRLRGPQGTPQEPRRGAPLPPVTAAAARVDADGFQEVVSRATQRKLRRTSSLPMPFDGCHPHKRILPELEGRCLNCLSFEHRVASCRLPRRCLRCRGFRHLAKNCKRPRMPPGGDASPRHFVRSPDGSGSPAPPPPLLSKRCGNGGQEGQEHSNTSTGQKRKVLGVKAPLLSAAATGLEGSGDKVMLGDQVPDVLELVPFELQLQRPMLVDHSTTGWDPMLIEAQVAHSLTRCASPLSQQRRNAEKGLPGAKQDLLGELVPALQPMDNNTSVAVPPDDVTPVLEEAATLGEPTQIAALCEPRSSDGWVEPCSSIGTVPKDSQAATKGRPDDQEVLANVTLVVEQAACQMQPIATIMGPEVDHSMALADFIKKVTKDIPAPLADKPLRRHRVDPVLVDAPPQLPSSEASGIRRSYRQALDPLSAIKTAKRGEVLLMRRLGEIGVPLPSTALADQAVKQFFQDEPPPHHWDALLDIYPMLKNKSKTSPSMGLSVD